MINLVENDLYVVNNEYFYQNYSRELNSLYLPIIGSNAIKLYDYLFYKLVDENKLSNKYIHYDLSSNLAIDIKQIFLARKKLEALGLIKTYYRKEDNRTMYIYKICRPLSFIEFFSNELLSEFLKNSLDDSTYQELRNRYDTSKIVFESFEEVSASFSEVYDSDIELDYKKEDVGPNLAEYYFDFKKLNYYLANAYLDVILEDSQLKNKILELAHLFKVSPEDMASAIEKSIDISSAGTEINLENLKNYLSQLFINVKRQDVPTLDSRLNKELYNEAYAEDKNEHSPKEKFAKKLDSMNYVDFLRERHSIILSEIDSRNTILKIQEKYSFSAGVLNVLLDYSIRESNGQGLPHFNYIDKIASTWSNQNLRYAIDAINFVATSSVNFKKSIKKNNYPRKTTKKNIVETPDFIKEQLEQMKKTVKNNKEDKISDVNFEDYLNEMEIE